MERESEQIIEPGDGDALVIVDLQNDFLPGGALGVSSEDGLIESINRCVEVFRARALPIVATRDWHPREHCSFHAQGGPWPPHCIAHTAGAAFANEFHLPRTAIIVDKATSQDRDAYSGFQDTGLAGTLRALGVRRVFLTGLATDYCVHATALDALDAGFQVMLLEDGMRAVDASAGDGERAIEEMHRHGALSVQIGRAAD